MTRFTRFLFLFALIPSAQILAAEAFVVHHNMNIRLSPIKGTLEVEDRIRLQGANLARRHDFFLDAGLDALVDGRAPKILSGDGGEAPTATGYRLLLPPGRNTATIHYKGRIEQGFSTIREGVGRTRRQTSGTISGNGVFLDGKSSWYPYFPGSLQTFSLRVQLPHDWMAVSQGRGPNPQDTTEHTYTSWEELQPQDDIYLVAAKFHFYSRESPDGESQVFLRSPDEALAERYLDATGKYLSYYSKILGPYPYAKFALVENFWATGYGMPSFTLLGSRVIRLPFILHTSYPHEILHNWWGNGVYVDYESGNWSEGLTTYLADHLLQEQRLEGPGYRRSALQRYQDFVRRDNDFTLREFRGRHDTTSQAVGYDKSLMFFHMLRQKLGDDAFFDALKKFFQEYRFKRAGYDELRSAFEKASGEPLDTFFSQWTTRTGAPLLSVDKVETRTLNDGYQIRARINQTQPEPPFPIRIPLVIDFAGDDPPLYTTVDSPGRESQFEILLPARPRALHVDPEFDLFRRVDPGEVPPTLGALFGAENGYILLPRAAPAPLASAYRELAELWRQGYPGLKIMDDSELDSLPEDEAVWLLGWENRFFDVVKSGVPRHQAKIRDDQVSINGESHPRPDHSLVLVLQDKSGSRRPLAWIAADSPQSLPGLARKLPHYGKYSYLVFSGSEPVNQVKGHWRVTGSPLSVTLRESPPPPPGFLDVH